MGRGLSEAVGKVYLEEVAAALLNSIEVLPRGLLLGRDVF